jgi:23S rRNA (uracil1939-C5)-methyltransferase
LIDRIENQVVTVRPGQVGQPFRAADRAEALSHPDTAGPSVTGNEVAARCRHFGVCGGCDWQDVPYARQLDRKRREVEARLEAALGSRAPRVEATLGTPVAGDGMPWGFRQKAAFVIGADPQRQRRLVVGHYARGSRRVVPIEECPVHGARANQLALALCDRLSRAGLRPAGRERDAVLRHMVVRTSADEREAVVMLVVTRNEKVLRAPLRDFVAQERPTGLLVNVNPRPGPLMVGPETIRVAGREHVRESRLPLAFLVSPAAFFQTNVEAAGVLLAHVLREVEAPGRDRSGGASSPLRILDLYAGSGLFALPLAARGHEVTAVEDNAQAVRDGRANQRLNRVAADRLRFLRADVEDALPRLALPAPDVVILDPPRQGCGPRALQGVFGKLAPARAIYVSCDLDALVRELPPIVDAGYRVSRVQPIDMFPHTAHVETVVTLER